MICCQSIPDRWLILGKHLDEHAWAIVATQLACSGIVLLEMPPAKHLRRLRYLAGLRQLTIVCEGRLGARRVHDARELGRALLQRSWPIFLSPIHETKSHPDWHALPRMRAAALARLAGRQVVALGGMNDHRYRRIAPLGFIGWAGITAWEKDPRRGFRTNADRRSLKRKVRSS